MKQRRSLTNAIVCFLSLLALQCTERPKPAPDTRATDEAAIRQADIDWSKTAEAKQMDAYFGYFAQDAMVLAPNEAIMEGQEAVRKSVSTMFEMPGFGLKWVPTKVEVARSGEMGYTVGTYEFTMNDPKGKPITDKGKYTTIWKKQADGSWKVAVDMFNSDIPLPPPPAKSK